MLLKYITIINHLIKKNYYNSYNDTFNFRTNEITINSQQTDITNNIETNTQTTNLIYEESV